MAWRSLTPNRGTSSRENFAPRPTDHPRPFPRGPAVPRSALLPSRSHDPGRPVSGIPAPPRHFFLPSAPRLFRFPAAAPRLPPRRFPRVPGLLPLALLLPRSGRPAPDGSSGPLLRTTRRLSPPPPRPPDSPPPSPHPLSPFRVSPFSLPPCLPAAAPFPARGEKTTGDAVSAVGESPSRPAGERLDEAENFP